MATSFRSIDSFKDRGRRKDLSKDDSYELEIKFHAPLLLSVLVDMLVYVLEISLC